MASKKLNSIRPSAQIQELLEQSPDSNVSDLKFDDTDKETNSDAVCNDTDSDAAVDYSSQQSACGVFNWLSGASTRQRAAFTGQSGIGAFSECSGPDSALDRRKIIAAIQVHARPLVI